MDKRVESIIKEIKNCVKNGSLANVFLEHNYFTEDELEEGCSISDLFYSNNDSILEDFTKNIDCDNIGCKEISNGVQSIAFIFDDIVYKVTVYDLSYINYFRSYLNDIVTIKYPNFFLTSLICPVNYITSIEDDVHIYSQEFISRDNIYSNTRHLDYSYYKCFTIDLGEAILNYYKDKKIVKELIEDFRSYLFDYLDRHSELTDDIHNGNWGFNKEGRPVIFDPFYFCI